ncbi:MAG TPA: hypothetical protein VK177_02015 [Flavobacteriales bacterium]|nr:hypothetical protein [Flavobacteriales bacterium]
MKTLYKPFLIVLLLLNLVVLMGQIMPEQAPPFARTVNIIFLALSMVFFVASLAGSMKKKN